MTDRKFAYIPIMVVSTVCIAILSHFFLPRFTSLKDFAAPKIKPAHFVIIAKENTLTVSINGEAQFRYTPQAKENYSISFFYPCKSELSELQIDY